MNVCRVVVLLKDRELAQALAVNRDGLSFHLTATEDQADPVYELLDSSTTLFVTDDGADLSRRAGENSRELAGVVIADPSLDPIDFGFDPLLVTFLPQGTRAAAIHAVLVSIARRLRRFMGLSERLARDESEIRRHHDESKRFLVAFMAGNERLRRLEENSTDWIWELGHDFRFSYSSSRGGEIMGLAPEEIIGREFSEFIPVAAGKETRHEVIRKLFGRQEKFSSREFVFERADGKRCISTPVGCHCLPPTVPLRAIWG